MNIFQKRIENLCDEIIGRILALMLSLIHI